MKDQLGFEWFGYLEEIFIFQIGIFLICFLVYEALEEEGVFLNVQTGVGKLKIILHVAQSSAIVK